VERRQRGVQSQHLVQHHGHLQLTACNPPTFSVFRPARSCVVMLVLTYML
jgi:hypothetical protein